MGRVSEVMMWWGTLRGERLHCLAANICTALHCRACCNQLHPHPTPPLPPVCAVSTLPLPLQTPWQRLRQASHLPQSSCTRSHTQPPTPTSYAPPNLPPPPPPPPTCLRRVNSPSASSDTVATVTSSVPSSPAVQLYSRLYSAHHPHLLQSTVLPPNHMLVLR